MSIYALHNNKISLKRSKKYKKKYIDRNRYRRLIIPLSDDNKLSGRKIIIEPDEIQLMKTHMLI